MGEIEKIQNEKNEVIEESIEKDVKMKTFMQTNLDL